MPAIFGVKRAHENAICAPGRRGTTPLPGEKGRGKSTTADSNPIGLYTALTHLPPRRALLAICREFFTSVNSYKVTTGTTHPENWQKFKMCSQKPCELSWAGLNRATMPACLLACLPVIVFPQPLMLNQPAAYPPLSRVPLAFFCQRVTNKQSQNMLVNRSPDLVSLKANLFAQAKKHGRGRECRRHVSFAQGNAGFHCMLAADWYCTDTERSERIVLVRLSLDFPSS